MGTLRKLYIVLFSILFAAFGTQAQAGPLQDAAISGDLDSVKRLLEQGVDPDEDGAAPPLFFASQRGHADVAMALMEAGANPNSMSRWGAPLHAAARGGHLDVINVLLENGADPNIQGGEDDFAPLHQAAHKGSTDVVEALLKHGANVNARTKTLETPLHFAILKERPAVAALLLENGAQPNRLAPIGDALATADVDAGRARALACTPCHTLEPNTMGMRSTTLWNIVGRPKASVDDYPYSKGLVAQGGVWDYESLNKFLGDGPGTVPGTTMYFGWEPDRETRIALIAYLRTLSENPTPLP
ncbi:MAG: ankyrin repeat domain-containing protein [Pseudomonadota bacterium]